MQKIKLNNNLECPALGLGTYMLSPDEAYHSTLGALKMEYSLVDTANAYVNERSVGRAMGFAEKLNISRSYMNKIEKGTKTASIDLLIEIAVYGGVTLDYLILGQSLAAAQVKENIRMMREALNVLEQSL